MEKINKTLTILEASENCYLYNGNIFGKKVVLSDLDSEDNWREVTEQEKYNIENNISDEIIEDVTISEVTE